MFKLLMLLPFYQHMCKYVVRIMNINLMLTVTQQLFYLS